MHFYEYRVSLTSHSRPVVSIRRDGMEHELQLCAVFIFNRRLAVVSGDGIGSVDWCGGVPPAHYIEYGGLYESRSRLVVMTEIII